MFINELCWFQQDTIFLTSFISMYIQNNAKEKHQDCKVEHCKAEKKNPVAFLLHSLHVIDNAALMNSYLIFCFLLNVQCVALGLIYCILCKPCFEHRIISFLVGFSMMLITTASECFININLFPQ